MDWFGRLELLAYMRQHKLAVVATVGGDGGPQSALVGIGVTEKFEVVFDTLATTRKHANLLRDRRVAVTFSGPGERTLQYEGVAAMVSVTAPDDSCYRAAYYEAWPEGLARVEREDLVYWRIVPKWARYSEYEEGAKTLEFNWPD